MKKPVRITIHSRTIHGVSYKLTETSTDLCRAVSEDGLTDFNVEGIGVAEAAEAVAFKVDPEFGRQ